MADMRIETSTSSTGLAEARHGPVATKLDVSGAVQDVHVDPQVGTPVDSAANPIEPPRETQIQLQNGGRMAEETSPTLYVADGEAQYPPLNGTNTGVPTLVSASPVPQPVAASNDDIFAEQFEFCDRILEELHKRSDVITSSLDEPSDWVNAAVPQYQTIGLSTIRQRLHHGEYAAPENFREDFKLMIRNALTFNPPMSPVHEAGKALDRFFDEKWRYLPPLHSQVISDDEYDDDSEEERKRMVASMERQIMEMKRNLDSMKRNGTKPYKERSKKKNVAARRISSWKLMSKQRKMVKNRREKARDVDDVLTFDQKKELADAVATLEPGAKLEQVVLIIHNAMPLIRNTEQVEVEIDMLPQSTLLELYEFVIRPLRTPATKHIRVGKGIGSRAMKRKSMDEEIEAGIELFGEGAQTSGATYRERNEQSSEESSSKMLTSDSE